MTLFALPKTDAPARPLNLSVLSGFKLQGGDTRIPLPAGTERLLAFLALRAGAVKRAFVAGSLWPDASEGHAFGNLRSALSRLGAGGRGAVRADRVDLELAAGVAVDVREGRALGLRLIAPGPPRDADLTLGSVAMLSSELLPGWYDDWVLVEAEQWRLLRLHALESLAAILTAAGRFGEAVVAAAASVRAEPLRESAHATLIRVHLAEGNHSEAVCQLERLRELLRDELGIEPSPALVSLVGGRPG